MIPIARIERARKKRTSRPAIAQKKVEKVERAQKGEAKVVPRANGTLA